MNGPNSARNGITLAAAATWRKGVALVFARMLLAMVVVVMEVEVPQWWLFYGCYPRHNSRKYFLLRV